jgi:hypothetical protein
VGEEEDGRCQRERKRRERIGGGEREGDRDREKSINKRKGKWKATNTQLPSATQRLSDEDQAGK